MKVLKPCKFVNKQINFNRYHYGKLLSELNQEKKSSEYLIKSIELSYQRPILPFSVLNHEILLN